MRRSHGGNARKQKRELSDATFLSVIGSTDPDGSVPPAGGTATGAAVHDVPDEDEPGYGVLTPAAQEQGLAPINGFVFSRYVLGTTACSGCHCDLVYYQDQDVLRRGFAFRCWVCQNVQTVTLGEE
ncbi:MAG: hypothetical protein NVSMB65_00710 [Chloroflexota bacterium]